MIVPTRSRPRNLAALRAAWAATATGAAELLVVVDHDDPELPGYLEVDSSALVMTERLRLGGTLNRVALERAGQYRAIGFMGDDHLPRTTGWDQALVDALEELGSGMVYADDLF